MLHIRGWRGSVGGLMMPIDTANQVVCTVGQIDGHSGPQPYHELSRQSGIEYWTPNYPINAPQCPHRICFGPL